MRWEVPRRRVQHDGISTQSRQASASSGFQILEITIQRSESESEPVEKVVHNTMYR